MKQFLWVLGCVLAVSMVVSPMAFADTTNITIDNGCNGVGCYSPAAQGTVVGTINVVQGSNAGTLNFTLTMAPGYALQVGNGVNFGFTLPSGTINNLTVNGQTNSILDLSNSHRIANSFGSFAFGISGLGNTGSTTDITTLSFTLVENGTITPGQLIAVLDGQGSSFGIQFCQQGGFNCAVYTGASPSGPTTVPEPPVTALLACSALACGGFLRRYL